MLGKISNSLIETSVYAGKYGFVIYSLRDLIHQKEWIYAEDTIAEDRSTEKSFDEQYAGGIEFLFPSDEEEIYGGYCYRDHGIMWRLPYRLDIREDKLEAYGYGEEGIHVKYCIELEGRNVLLKVVICNKSQLKIPFLARLHPAFLIASGMELTGNTDEIIFEEEMKYCNLPLGKTSEIGKTAVWGNYNIFYHAAQSKGEFILKDRERSICFQYDKEKLPYLTVCSFIKDGNRIGIIEPANAAGVSLNSMHSRGNIPVLMPDGTITYDFRIIPE